VKKLVPDLFLLDYQLPDINGLELADRLQATEALKHIPILLMSANLPKQEAEKRQIAFLEKPFGMDELLQTIEKLLVS
jgi:CheY-like chemotaxis protein